MSEKQALTNPAPAFAGAAEHEATLRHSRHALKCPKESKQNILFIKRSHARTMSVYGYV